MWRLSRSTTPRRSTWNGSGAREWSGMALFRRRLRGLHRGYMQGGSGSRQADRDRFVCSRISLANVVKRMLGGRLGVVEARLLPRGCGARSTPIGRPGVSRKRVPDC
ncbi:hypothetical protein PLANTIT3_100042 [Plantibacter sp. T3]|nr:hypothetical protein PLANTIT3_100042 [Plantibacter sp. T3]